MNFFKYYILRKRYTISDLQDPRTALNATDRNLVKILIVDDDVFNHEDRLRRLGFNIQKYDDIESLEAAEAFQVIICDVKGVGKKFGSQIEGAFVLNQLKKAYPMKEYAVYSSSLYNSEMTTALQGISIINKDQPSEDWCNDVDSLIRKVTNPKLIWQKIAFKMIENNIPTRVIQKVEHEFVECVRDKAGDFTGFPSSKCLSDVDGDVSGIIHSLIAGTVLLPISI